MGGPVSGSAGANVGINGLLNMTKQRGLYSQAYSQPEQQVPATRSVVASNVTNGNTRSHSTQKYQSINNGSNGGAQASMPNMVPSSISQAGVSSLL